nr:Rho termination factor N-terminal domain-containing protein [Rothia sp. ZJ1223]
MTRVELYKIAQQLKLTGRSAMNKEQLLIAVATARGQV